MEIELYLDTSGARTSDLEAVEKRLREWHSEGAEIRYEKPCFGAFTILAPPNRYQIDLGNVDPLSAIRDLHARVYRYGVRIFVHFFP